MFFMQQNRRCLKLTLVAIFLSVLFSISLQLFSNDRMDFKRLTPDFRTLMALLLLE
jgi:hypothetical protein